MPATDVRARDLTYDQPAVTPPAGTPHADAPVEGAPSCPECGAPVPERFCGRCGEARPLPGRLRLRKLVAEFVEHLTSLDFRVVRTVSALVRRPGVLTRDFIAGRRARYTRPLSLYLLVSAGFFLLSPHLPGTLGDATAAVTGNSSRTPIGKLFDGVGARTGETRAQIAARIRRSPVTTPRAAAAMLAPILTVGTAIVTMRRRRFLAEHVLFAVHLQTYLLVHAAVTLASFAMLARVITMMQRSLGVRMDAAAFRLSFTLVILAAGVLLVGHVTTALQRVYGFGRGPAAWRAMVLLASIPIGVFAGRLVLMYLVALVRVG